MGLPTTAAIAGVVLLLGATAGTVAARCIPVAQMMEGSTLHALHRGGGSDAHPKLWAAQDAKPATPKSGTPKSANRGPALPSGQVEITFLGHSSFLIRTHKNAAAITDYNGYNRASFPPDIVTMNRAHESHYTDNVEPGVKHILRGWMVDGKIPVHDVTVRDLRVTNVQTNIREYLSDAGGIAGNSIFVFESAGLCIAHLGHLHHRLQPKHAGRVGSVDIMLAPIDNSWTMSHETLSKVIDDLKPQVVIPMHYGGYGTANLDLFLAMMTKKKFAIRQPKSTSARFAKVSLPSRQTVVVLQRSGY